MRSEHILFVGQESTLAKHLVDALSSEGHEISLATDTWSGLEIIQNFGCDLLILHLKSLGMSPLEFLKTLTQKYKSTPPVLILSDKVEKKTVIELLRLGVSYLLESPIDHKEVVQMVKTLQLKKRHDARRFQMAVLKMNHSKLTKRETEIAELVSAGLTNEEVSKKLSISYDTVKSHLRKIYQKLNIINRTELSKKIA